MLEFPAESASPSGDSVILSQGTQPTTGVPESLGYGFNWTLPSLNHGHYFLWTDLPARFNIDPDGTPDIAGTTDEFNAIRNSFNTWENDYFSGIDFTDNGTGVHETASTIANPNGNNVFCWIDRGNNGQVGLTHTWYYVDNTYRIGEVDTELNDYYTWMIGAESNKYDVQNVATHEVGHWLWLVDLYTSTNTNQTMYYTNTTATELIKRTLDYGDMNGVHYIYPIENDAGTDGDASNTFSGANTISISYTYSGRLCCFPSHNDTQDYYKVSVGSTYRLAFRMTPPSWANFDLELYYPNGTLADYSRNTGNGVQEIITKDPMGVTGDWRIRVYASSAPIVGNGNYTFSITNLPQFVQTQEQEEVE